MEKTARITELLLKASRLNRVYKDSNESKVFSRLNKSLVKAEKSRKLVGNLKEILSDVQNELSGKTHVSQRIIKNGDLGQIILTLRNVWIARLDQNWKIILHDDYEKTLKIILHDFFLQPVQL